MKIAIPYQNGQVFPHFGHAPQFKFYTIESGMILHTEVVETAGSGHSAVTAFLMRGGVDTLICGSIGAGVAIAGTFSLVRFRSVPGTAREILAVFLSMAAGLACGMGCVAVAAVFTLLICLVYAVLSRSRFGEEKNGDKHRTMNITVPESLEYAGAFDDIFETYTESCRLVRVKTTGLGSLNRLTYDIMLRRPGEEKAFIDALRCRNGNLEISLTQHAAEGCEL